MIEVTAQERKDIYELYDEITDISLMELKPEHALKFLRLRKLIFNVRITRECEFQILKLLLEKMAGVPKPYRPRIFIDYDFHDLNEVERKQKRLELRRFFKDLPLTGDYMWSSMSTKINEIMPAKSRYDIEFGLEALRSILAVSDELNKSMMHPGPVQSGEPQSERAVT